MKILWFSNTPSLYAEKHSGKTVLGGWIPSLEKLFREQKIDLRIAFHADVEKLTQDTHNSSEYYLIPGVFGKSKLERLKLRWLNARIKREVALLDYQKIIDDFKPDLVQIWGSEQMFGLIIPYLKVPHILHVQGNLTAYQQKYYSGFSKQEVLKALSLKKWLNREPYFFSEKNFWKEVEEEKEIFSYCKNFFGRTEWDKRIVKVMAPNANYFHCDEIMRDDFMQIEWKPTFTGKTLRLISVFRDSIYKGFESIYDSANILKEKGIAFTWDVIGVDEKSQSLAVLKKNRTYDVADLPINLHGFVGADTLSKIYLKSDLFVHTSHIDNSPNSVCEAMILGIPIISTNVGGIPSLIEDAVFGTLVQDGDNLALCGAIMQTAEEYKSACFMAQRGREKALKRHDKQIVLNTVLETYNKLLLS